LRLLLDAMYAGIHADALRAVDVDACTVIELGLAGSSDPEVFAEAVAQGRALLTENVADFTRISAEHLTCGQHHPGVLIALSSRFSRRPAGIPSLVEAILGVAGEQLADRGIYL
jgi:predicted nuclease of predicted toxin-antitoxin system